MRFGRCRWPGCRPALPAPRWSPSSPTNRAATRRPRGGLRRTGRRGVFRRPRTRVRRGLLGWIRVVMGTAIGVPGGAGGPAAGLIAATAGNGMALPVLALTLALALLLPLGV